MLRFCKRLRALLRMRRSADFVFGIGKFYFGFSSALPYRIDGLCQPPICSNPLVDLSFKVLNQARDEQEHRHSNGWRSALFPPAPDPRTSEIRARDADPRYLRPRACVRYRLQRTQSGRLGRNAAERAMGLAGNAFL